jgi:hypothetical protein
MITSMVTGITNRHKLVALRETHGFGAVERTAGCAVRQLGHADARVELEQKHGVLRCVGYDEQTMRRHSACGGVLLI